MKAAITTKAGDPTVIEIQEVDKPETRSGWVLIKVEALGQKEKSLLKYKLTP